MKSEYQIREMEFRGVKFKIACKDRLEYNGQDPSYYTFEDEHEVRLRDWDIKPRDAVIDIGSCVGSYALTALYQGCELVICFNPDVEENQFLIESNKLNSTTSSMRIYNHGLWSQTGHLNSSTLEFRTTKFDNSFFVMKFDDIEHGLECRKYHKERVVMKLDVEGAELEVLKGAENFLKKYKPIILVENHLFKIPSIEVDVQRYLCSLGYILVSSHPYHGVSHSLYQMNYFEEILES